VTNDIVWEYGNQCNCKKIDKNVTCWNGCLKFWTWVY